MTTTGTPSDQKPDRAPSSDPVPRDRPGPDPSLEEDGQGERTEEDEPFCVVVADFLLIDRSFEKVEAELSPGSQGFADLADTCIRSEFARAQAMVGATPWAFTMDDVLLITSQRTTSGDQWARYVVHWCSPDPRADLRSFDVEFEIAAFGLDQTSLVVNGRWEAGRAAYSKEGLPFFAGFAKAATSAFVRGIEHALEPCPTDGRS